MYSGIRFDIYKNVYFDEICISLDEILGKNSESIFDGEIYSPPE